MVEKYGFWPESSGILTDAAPKVFGRITAGVDIGTTSSQAAVFIDGKLIGWSNIHTGSDFRQTAEKVVAIALESSGIDLADIDTVVATGFGQKAATYASRSENEIICHAKGARFMFGPDVMTVVDLGGQSTHAISLFEWDRVRSFSTNDKCATGMGRHIETVAGLMQIPITEMGKKSFVSGADPEPVSTTCFNFAYPEAIGLFRQGYKSDAYSERDVLAAYLFAISWRILGTIGKLSPLDIGEIILERELAFTGGLAKNEGIIKRLERDLKMTAVTSKYDPQLAGAIGAALLA